MIRAHEHVPACDRYDIVVIGGGHAGTEAARAAEISTTAGPPGTEGAPGL